MSDEVSITVTLLVLFQPVGVSRDVPAGDGVLACKRRIPYKRVESGPIPLEHLRQLDLPVERRERGIRVALFREPTAVAPGLAVHHCVRELLALRFSLLRLL